MMFLLGTEDGDVFGTPVQMAARALSKAEGDEIAVSNLVREMCTGPYATGYRRMLSVRVTLVAL